MGKLILVAVGGNALIRAGQKGTAQEQFENAVETANAVIRLIKSGHRVVLTHGNGPQVGAMLTRTELAAAHAYRLPLDCCVAATQGEIGYVLQYAMWQAMQQEGLHVPVVSLITQVLVDANDPAFQNPTKPIGPFYTKDQAERYRDLFNWVIVDDAARGYRRVVSSPEPKEIIELEAIRACVDRGLVVLAGGGGGIPVFNDHDLSKGVEAVIDKDHTSAILAAQLGADMFVICTDVAKVCLDYRKPTQRTVDTLTVAECQAHLAAGQFPAGSMGPKIRAMMVYATRQRGEAIITNYEHLIDAIDGNGGTRVLPDPDT
ncbi:MAG: carbamate kinase [Ignavibacteriae bacterium]|nr:carbamate kinase [Ignavibacteriota bacterium]